MNRVFFVMFFLAVLCCHAQEETRSFREDQIYFSASYPYFSEAPNDLIQNKLSHSFSLGFIRDMPVNNKRTVALGLGIGWDYTKIYNNFRFDLEDSQIVARPFEEVYEQNHLTMHSIAIPLEFRWRNATETRHAFWRVHTGIALHIPLQLNSHYITSGGTNYKSALPLNDTFLRWNVHFGFNTWNISIAHDVQPWAVSAAPNGTFDIRFTKIGLIFYIL